MRAIVLTALATLIGLAATGSALSIDTPDIAQPRQLGGYLQCVPYARKVTGIAIYGDAHTWWNQAAGKFARGSEPKVGAVMNFRPHGNSRLGHVAAVSRIIDDRTILIRHANWSAPGKIENDVRAIDVSPDNDWSEVRVWNGTTQHMGGGTWPLYGFIYPQKPGKPLKVKDKPTGLFEIAKANSETAVGKGSALTKSPKRVAVRLAAPLAHDPIGMIITGRR